METMRSLIANYWIYYGLVLFLGLDSSNQIRTAAAMETGARRGHNCTFPAKWVGHWYKEGEGQIEIKPHHVKGWGHCFTNVGQNKFLLLNKEKECLKCMVFTEQHENLLQYKQSYCEPMSKSAEEMEAVCSDILGDNQLHTMVRENGTPIPCPMQGDYSFSYTITDGAVCSQPESSIHACADNSKFLIHHRSCPRINYSYAKLSTFQCLAVWGDGVDKYLYGYFQDPNNPTTLTYRCFMYNLYGTRGHMSMSADATCKGLQAPDVGMNVMELIRVSRVPHQPCQFPDFVSGVKKWRDLTGVHHLELMNYGKELRTFHTPMGVANLTVALESKGTELRAACYGELALEHFGERKEALYVAHVTDDSCESSYRCIRFLQRTKNMLELIIGKPADQIDFACQETNLMGQPKQVYIPADMNVIPCPRPGVYNFRHTSRSCQGQLTVGCGARESEMVIDSNCKGEGEFVSILQCYAAWVEHGQQYIIAGRVGRLFKTADCLVSKPSASGLELTSDPSCGGGQVDIMRFPFSLYLQTPPGSCLTTSTTRPQVVNPAESQVPRDQTGIYDTQRSGSGNGSGGNKVSRPTSGIIETPPGKSGVINKGNNSQLSLYLLLSLQMTVVMIMSHFCR